MSEPALQPPGAVETVARATHLANLIRGMAERDQGAMSALYDATNRLVYSLVLRILSDPASAEEVMLDVYMQVWRQASTYDEKRGGPLAWLTTVARSRAIDRLRSGKQRQQREEPLERADNHSAPANIEEEVAASEMRGRVQAALEQLSPEQREVIELAYYGGLSHSEIAAKLGQPLGTVKTRTRLGMMKLRDSLKDVQDERGL
ncbi:MAG TPA: sigma-70 family RNA polymerase sigma factor [Pyrinomonadaceae bacterium]|jgi:RNA polymerase sigma-70 factor (ECF subfamily)